MRDYLVHKFGKRMTIMDEEFSRLYPYVKYVLIEILSLCNINKVTSYLIYCSCIIPIVLLLRFKNCM